METKFNKLESIGKAQNPFKVPDDYFARFNEEIMNRLPEKETAKPQTVSLWDKVKPWVYMAAMFAGLYVAINFVTRGRDDAGIAQNETGQQRQTLADFPQSDNYWSTVHITEDEFYQYLEEQLVDDGYNDYMYNQLYLN